MDLGRGHWQITPKWVLKCRDKSKLQVVKPTGYCDGLNLLGREFEVLKITLKSLVCVGGWYSARIMVSSPITILVLFDSNKNVTQTFSIPAKDYIFQPPLSRFWPKKFNDVCKLSHVCKTRVCFMDFLSFFLLLIEWACDGRS